MNNTFHLAAIGDLRWSMHQSLRRAILQMMEFYKNKIFKYKKNFKKKIKNASVSHPPKANRTVRADNA